KADASYSLESLTARHAYRLRLALGDAKRQPTITLDAEATTGAILDAKAKAVISRWPDAWQLPFPLPNSASATAIDVSYQGPVLMTSPIAFDVRRGDASLKGQFVLADLRTWIAR